MKKDAPLEGPGGPAGGCAGDTTGACAHSLTSLSGYSITKRYILGSSFHSEQLALRICKGD